MIDPYIVQDRPLWIDPYVKQDRFYIGVYAFGIGVYIDPYPRPYRLLLTGTVVHSTGFIWARARAH
jgi:hypothetical protein